MDTRSLDCFRTTASRGLRSLLAAIALSVPLLAPQTARAEEGIVRYGVTAQSLQNDFFDGYADDGYRPARLTGYRSGDSVRYFTRWVDNDGRAWSAYYGVTGDGYHDRFVDLRDRGYHPVDVSGYNTPSGVRYAAIWERNTTGVAWRAYRDSTREGMQHLVDTIGQDGWRPRRVEAYTIGGESRYISLWEHDPGTGYRMHNKMTRAQYQAHLEDYAQQGLALVHLDAHTQGGEVYYSGIWRRQNRMPRVRTNRDWRTFQRYYNNSWADGYVLENFYATDTPDGIRYGGVWFYEGPLNITASSSLRLRVRKEVDGAPARGGAAILNLTTGQEIMLHADQEFAIASTSKIGILYALLREIDLGNESWAATMNSGAVYGNNQGNWIQANTNYTIQQFAQFMIRSSNNWATNRLIQRIGRARINDLLEALGLETTRIHRYMLGTGAPSAHGNNSAWEDHDEGWENLSTPREMVTLLKKVLTTNVLSFTSRTRFWNTLGMDGNNDGVNTKSYVASQVAPMYNPPIVVFNKPGDVGDVRIHHADAGRMSFPNGEQVLFAIFVDEISDDPDEQGVASATTDTAAKNAIRNVGKEVAIEYYP
jgi:beta-lactamase class A